MLYYIALFQRRAPLRGRFIRNIIERPGDSQ